MGKSGRDAKPRRNARDYLDTHAFGMPSGDLASDWATGDHSRSLFLNLMNRSSDFSFVEDMYTRLVDILAENELPTLIARPLLAEVIAAPSFSASREVDRQRLVRQAVLIEANAACDIPFCISICVDLMVNPKHAIDGRGPLAPSKLSSFEIHLELFDLEDDDEVTRALNQFLLWLRDFPAPNVSSRDSKRSVVFLGNLGGLSCSGLPKCWKSKLEELTQAFEYSASFHRGPDYTAPSGEDDCLVVRFQPHHGDPPLDAHGREVPSNDIDASGKNFSDLFRDVVLTLLDDGTPDVSNDPNLRLLRPGEHVFHRKIGNNRRYDNFDEGSEKPCRHRENSFVPFNGDKCVKGMKHRYPNFRAEWLRHCKKYPNCNVYAVFVPDSLDCDV